MCLAPLKQGEHWLVQTQRPLIWWGGQQANVLMSHC
jgi:hypothetical protein